MLDQEKDFNTAEELVEFFQRQSIFRTKKIWDVHKTGRGGFIFRGQSDADWKLTSNVFRSHDVLENYCPQTASDCNDVDKRSYLGWQLHSEVRAVRIFLEAADKLGITTPFDYSSVKHHLEYIRAALSEEDYDYSQNFPSEGAIEEFALAQHHGVPTRLLDWTGSPLIACYFAAIGASSIAGEVERVRSSHIAIYCFNEYALSKSDEIIQVKVPRHKNSFLLAQQGVFTHIVRANSYFLENGRWPNLDDIIDGSNELNRSIRKYRLPTSEADNLLRILYDNDITRHQLMPTLENVAKSFLYTKKLFPAA